MRISISAVVAFGLGLALVACGGSRATGAPAGQAQPPGGQPAVVQQGDRLTAYEAYQLLLPKIKEWQAKATIAIGEPKEPSNGQGKLGLDGRSAAWRFICASPDEQAYALFEIDTSKEAKSQVRVATSNVRRPAVTALVDPAAWKVDSSQALEIAQGNSLKEWLAEHPAYGAADTVLELRASAEEGAYWRITAHEGADTIDFRISAVDGQVYYAQSH